MEAPCDNVKTARQTWGKLFHFLEFIWKPLLALLLATIAGLVFFPFQIATSIPAGVSIAFSVVIGVTATGRRKLVWLTSAIVIAIIGVGWATLGIFVIFPGPLYCHSGNTANPLDARITSIGTAKSPAHVFYIADPVRSSALVKKIATTLSASLIFIDTDDQGAQPSMLIPLSGSVTHTVLGTTDVASAQERRLSYYGPALAVEYENHAIRIGIGTGYFAIVDYVRKANEVRESRWEAVQYFPKFESNAVIYVASLDRALLAAASGDSQSAIEILEVAYDYAPSDLERARDRALLGVVCRAILVGTIGNAQSLSYMNQAMQYWVRSANPTPAAIAGRSTVLDRWMYHLFRSVFFYHQAEYPEWTALLAFTKKPSYTKKDEPESDGIERWGSHISLADSPEQSLLSAETRRLLSLILQNDGPDAVPEAVSSQYGHSLEMRRWLAETLLSGDELDVTQRWAHPELAERLDRAKDWAIQQLPEPWHQRYADCRRWEKTVIRALNSHKQGKDAWSMFAPLGEVAKETGFVAVASLYEELAVQSTSQRSEEPQLVDTGKPPDVPWWDQRFVDWFGATSMIMFVNITDECHKVSGRECRVLLSGALRQLERDHRGKGHLFTPGLMLVLTIAQDVHQPLDDDWVLTYKEASGATELPPVGTKALLPF